MDSDWTLVRVHFDFGNGRERQLLIGRGPTSVAIEMVWEHQGGTLPLRRDWGEYPIWKAGFVQGDRLAAIDYREAICAPKLELNRPLSPQPLLDRRHPRLTDLQI